MSLTLPIVIGRKYVRRDGTVVTAKAAFPGFIKGCLYVGDSDKAVSRSSEHAWAHTGKTSGVNVNNPCDLIADHIEAQIMTLKATATRTATRPTVPLPALFRALHGGGEMVWLLGNAPDGKYFGVLVQGIASNGTPYLVGTMDPDLDLADFEPFYGSVTLEQTP